jgi:hypothetical protein
VLEIHVFFRFCLLSDTVIGNSLLRSYVQSQEEKGKAVGGSVGINDDRYRCKKKKMKFLKKKTSV